MGRIIKNHSTHIEGLFNILSLLSKNQRVKSVTPGSLKRVRANCERMDLRITREVKGGFKIVARKGKMAQVVYILTEMKDKELKELIGKTLEKVY